MRKIYFGIATAVCWCLLLTACGTYRAITDDYEPDYIIRDITPLHGVSGQQVTFDAAICETAGSTPLDDVENPPQWIWNFGGGADPNVSYEANPQVMLRSGANSPYEGSLTVRGGCVEDQEVSATFTLNVTGLSVLAVTPLTGTSGSTATFSAIIGSGSVTEYSWDFGGACSPSGSNVQNPSVTFGAADTYECRLIVANNYEAVEFPFTVTVN